MGVTISGMTGAGSIRHNNRSFSAANVDPVSYTHLDVYKRQGQPVIQPRRPNSRLDKVRHMFQKVM